MAKNGSNDLADFTSGFRPYPQQGFQIQPQKNYWQGGNFYAPGVSGSAPMMTSSIMNNFPALAGILKMQSPQPFPQTGGAPFVGALPTPQAPTLPQAPKSRRDMMLEELRQRLRSRA